MAFGFEQVEEKIGKSEESLIEITQSDEPEERKMDRGKGTYGTLSGLPTYSYWSLRRRRERLRYIYIYTQKKNHYG